MKKIIVMTALLAASAMLFVGCGDSAPASDTTAESTPAAADGEPEIVDDTNAVIMSELKASDYVTLGEYKGLKGELAVETVSDDDVQEQIDYALESKAEETEVTGRAVMDGDIVNIDYVGKKDGVALDKCTGSGYDLTIGSGSFIPGFEDGLIGHEIGESVDLNLTFPEHYQAEDLAGQEVVFTVTINSIKEKKIPELTDALASELEETCKTADDYREYVRQTLQDSQEKTAISTLKSNLLNQAIENATVNKVPQWLIDDKDEFFRQSVEAYASSYGMTMDNFVEQALGKTSEEFDEQCEEYAMSEAKQALVVTAIAQAEGIEPTKDEINVQITLNASSLSSGSYDEEMKTVEGRCFAQYVELDKVTQFLYDNAQITEK